jgi:tight adherence protein B
MLVLFLVAVLAMMVGCVGLIRLAQGHPVLPMRTHRAPRREVVSARVLGAALLAGALVFVTTRWPVAAVLAAALVVLWPKLVGGGADDRAGVAKIEAVATWTESLRDTAAAASGLEYAIPATLEGAPRLLERPLRNLVHRLAARVPLPQALTMFADEVDDPGADMVVAALSLNARQRAGSLSRVLSALAATTRGELEMRRKVLHERNAVRRQSLQVAGLAVFFAAGQAVFAPGWVQPYATPAGQAILGVLAAAYLGLVVRLRRLAMPEPQPRFLGQPEVITEMASYKPWGVAT